MTYRNAMMPLMFLVAVSCKEAGFGLSAPVASVTVSPASATLSAPGETLRLAAAQDAQGSTVANATFTWASTGRTGDGGELFSLRFDMEPVADANGASVFVATLPVRGEWEEGLARIHLTGPEGVAVLDESSDRPMAILRDPVSGRVRGILRGAPPSTLAQRDLASAVSEPGLDVLLSRGLPGASAWRR